MEEKLKSALSGVVKKDAKSWLDKSNFEQGTFGTQGKIQKQQMEFLWHCVRKNCSEKIVLTGEVDRRRDGGKLFSEVILDVTP